MILLRTIVGVVINVVDILLDFRIVASCVASASTLFTSHVGVVDMHDFLLLLIAFVKLLYEQVHLGRQHIHLFDLMHAYSLVWLSAFFVPSLVQSYLLNKSGGFMNSE
jgi:hypothetical protein